MSRAIGLATLLVFFCCASLRLTPQQEHVYKMFDEYKLETNSDTAGLVSIAPNGDFSYSTREGNQYSTMQTCLQAKGFRRPERPAEPRKR